MTANNEVLFLLGCLYGCKNSARARFKHTADGIVETILGMKIHRPTKHEYHLSQETYAWSTAGHPGCEICQI